MTSITEKYEVYTEIEYPVWDHMCIYGPSKNAYSLMLKCLMLLFEFEIFRFD